VTAARPVPAGLADTIGVLTDTVPSDDLAWKVARLVEHAYGQGYEDGHRRGHREGWDRARIAEQTKDPT
jgi:hypothetical protein